MYIPVYDQYSIKVSPMLRLKKKQSKFLIVPCDRDLGWNLYVQYVPNYTDY